MIINTKATNLLSFNSPILVKDNSTQRLMSKNEFWYKIKEYLRSDRDIHVLEEKPMYIKIEYSGPSSYARSDYSPIVIISKNNMYRQNRKGMLSINVTVYTHPEKVLGDHESMFAGINIFHMDIYTLRTAVGMYRKIIRSIT